MLSLLILPPKKINKYSELSDTCNLHKDYASIFVLLKIDYHA